MAERGDVGALRRAQIVEAATRVIARKGFHNATLAEVEAEAGISRGMMTYHFPTKDAMIAAVFAAMLDRVREATLGAAGGARGRERVERILAASASQHDADDAFLSLHLAFLAQASHRPDYRAGLAALYAAIRDDLATDLQIAGISPAEAPGRAALLLAGLHGLAAQRQADPSGFDPRPAASALLALIAPADPTISDQTV